MGSILAYITGLVNQRLLLQCEYLDAGNRILRSQLPERLRVSDTQSSILAEIGKRLGRSIWPRLLSGQARHHPRVVPAAHCPQVRRIRASGVTGTPARRSEKVVRY
jgi:hypothetical protein